MSYFQSARTMRAGDTVEARRLHHLRLLMAVTPENKKITHRKKALCCSDRACPAVVCRYVLAGEPGSSLSPICGMSPAASFCGSCSLWLSTLVVASDPLCRALYICTNSTMLPHVSFYYLRRVWMITWQRFGGFLWKSSLSLWKRQIRFSHMLSKC